MTDVREKFSISYAMSILYPLKYQKVMEELTQKVRNNEITFLEYQAKIYNKIDEIVREFKRDYVKCKPSYLKLLREKLQEMWLRYDPCVEEWSKINIRRFQTFLPERGELKCLLIAKHLVDAFLRSAAKQ